MEGWRKMREAELSALLIAPDRELAAAFCATVPELRAFQVQADLRSYPSRAALDIRLRQIRPEVVLLDVATDLETAADLLRFLAGVRPAVQVVALHRSRDPDALVRVLRLGACEFLHAPFEPAEQREALARLRRLRPPERDVVREAGRLIVFSSAKPGAGASTLAAHAAHALRRAGSGRVLLLDLDLAGGTIAFQLKLRAEHSVRDALQHAGEIDAGLWATLTVDSAGVDVLPAPEAPDTEPVEPAALEGVLNYARLIYDWVVADAPVLFDPVSLLAISECDRLYLVSTADLASLHLARKAVNVVDQLGFARPRCQVVVNRLSRHEDIGGADIEKIVRRPVPAIIPDDQAGLHRAVSLGQPLSADSAVGKKIAALAAQIAATALEPPTGVPASIEADAGPSPAETPLPGGR